MFAGAISAMIESLGDYYAAARISGAPVPPPDVLARGVTWQGISCVLTGEHLFLHQPDAFPSPVGCRDSTDNELRDQHA